MKAVGIVVEYNPFHNGHLYHVQQAKEKSGADIVIAVMSGPFLQRGEPAIVSKWARTEMALKGGVNIVVELPYSFATQHASIFASGAVDILHSLGCDYICFGSESGNIQEFIQTFDYLQKNEALENEYIKQYVNEGYSYPKAKSFAIEQITSTISGQPLNLSTPNNILGYEYYKAVKKNHYPIELLTIARKQADYHDEYFSSETIASATSIRKEMLKEDSIQSIEPFIPGSTLHILQTYKDNYQVFHTWENYWSYLKFRLLQLTPRELASIYEVEEGLENRIIKYAKQADSFHHFMSLIKTKRYTWTRLQRICVHILTNTTKVEMSNLTKPAYIRLLGTSKMGRTYLKEKKKNILLPVISKLSSYQHHQLDLDIRASRIFAFGAPLSSQQELIDIDYKMPPIMIDTEK